MPRVSANSTYVPAGTHRTSHAAMYSCVVYRLNISCDLVRAIFTAKKTSVALELLLNRYAQLKTLPRFAFSLSLGNFEQ